MHVKSKQTGKTTRIYKITGRLCYIFLMLNGAMKRKTDEETLTF